jgi:hypothetical protein
MTCAIYCSNNWIRLRLYMAANLRKVAILICEEIHAPNRIVEAVGFGDTRIPRHVHAPCTCTVAKHENPVHPSLLNSHNSTNSTAKDVRIDDRVCT